MDERTKITDTVSSSSALSNDDMNSQKKDDPPTYVNDKKFIQDLELLRDLRFFILQEATKLDESDSATLELGQLNSFRYQRYGRCPTNKEWKQVEHCTRILFGFLTPSLRKKFLLGLPPRLLEWLPLPLIIFAVLSLLLAVMIDHIFDIFSANGRGSIIYPIILQPSNQHGIIFGEFPCYVVWLMSLGAIGAIAFIAMNALSVQQDITFDVTNRRLIIMRIVLGALFGLVLTLPFGFQQFVDFCEAVESMKPGQSGGSPPTNTIIFPGIMLVLPFIFGFSTSLVILILKKFVYAVQGFFGLSDSIVINRHQGAEPTTTYDQQRVRRVTIVQRSSIN